MEEPMKCIVIFLCTFFIVSCNSGRVYKNYTNRYQVTCPKEWILLSSSNSSKEQTSFLRRITGQDTLINHEHVDALFCNPKSGPPDYSFISVASIPGYVKLEFQYLDIELLESLILLELIKKYDNPQIISSRSERLGRYQFGVDPPYRVDYTLGYRGTSLMATTVIMPGNMKSTQLFTTIYKANDKVRVIKKLKKVLYSYKKIPDSKKFGPE